jgi:atypical dual specificity phosphatase
VLALIAAEAGRRAVLVTTHNQNHARRLGGTTALLVGGRIVEHRPTAEFFDDPRTAPARQFVRTGSCYPPEQEASDDEEPAAPGSGPGRGEPAADTAGRPGPPTVVANPSVRREPSSASPPAPDAGGSAPALPEPRDLSAERRRQIAAAGAGAFGPRGFRWLRPGRLGGTPRPGLLDDTPDADLAALAQIGVTVLVTLEEEPFDSASLARHGIEPAFSPVRDMEAPAVEAAAALCGRIAAWNAAGRAVAVHCRAGLGRTGTQMAAQLIWEGAGPLEALEAVRRIDPRWVQSEAQVQFLRRFAARVKGQVKGESHMPPRGTAGHEFR